MRKQLTILFLLFSFLASAQKYTPFYTYGTWFYRVHADSVLQLPEYSTLDTSFHDKSVDSSKAQVRITQGQLWYYSHLLGKWQQAGSGTTSTVQEKDSLALAKLDSLAATFPAQFHPIAGTNMSLSGTYPNITFNSTAASTGGGLQQVGVATGIRSVNDSTVRLDTLYTDARYGLWKDDGTQLSPTSAGRGVNTSGFGSFGTALIDNGNDVRFGTILGKGERFQNFSNGLRMAFYGAPASIMSMDNGLVTEYAGIRFDSGANGGIGLYATNTKVLYVKQNTTLAEYHDGNEAAAGTVLTNAGNGVMRWQAASGGATGGNADSLGHIAASGYVLQVTGKGLSTEDYTTAEKTKLAGIASGATANSSDATLLNRANHTGTQLANTITEDATHRFTTDAEKSTWNSKQNTITLTTTGTSGVASLVGSTLNIPQYSGGGGSGLATNAFSSKSVLFRGASAISEDNSKFYYDSTLSKLSAFKTFTTDSNKVLHTVIDGGLITATDSIGAAIGTDSIYLYDDSWGFGAGVTTGGTAYATQVANNLKTTLVNKSISGTSLTLGSAGDSSLFDRIYTLPIYRSTLRAIMIGYIINDRGSGRSTATFTSQYKQIIDTLTMARGWPSSKIVLLGKGLNSSTAKATMKVYVDSARSVALQKGTQFIDVFNYEINNGGLALTSSDSLHPNNAGHTAVAQSIIYRLVGSGAVKVNGTLTVNGDVSLGSKTLFKSNIDYGALTGGLTPSIYLINGGTTSTRAGISHTHSTGVTYVFGRTSFNTLFGQGDPSTLTTTTSAFYIDGTNNLHINKITDSVVFPLGGAQAKILFNNGASTTSRAGLSYLSNGTMGMFNGTWDMLFGTRNDPTTLTNSTAAMYIDGSGNGLHLNRLSGAAVWTSTGSENKLLFADGGSSTTRAGISYNGASTGVLGIFNKSFPIAFKADGADVATLTTANSAYYIDATNKNNFNTAVAMGSTLSVASTLTTAGKIDAFAAKTAAYTATVSDEVITADATTGAFSVTLPTAVSKKGQEYVIKKVDVSANAVTVATTSSQTIDGSTTYPLSGQWKYVKVVSDGANWLIISSN